MANQDQVHKTKIRLVNHVRGKNWMSAEWSMCVGISPYRDRYF